MKITKILPTDHTPAKLRLLRGSGVIAAEIAIDGEVTSGKLYPKEIDVIQFLIPNFNLIFDSL